MATQTFIHHRDGNPHNNHPDNLIKLEIVDGMVQIDASIPAGHDHTDNPGLHRFYVQQAVAHLHIVDRAIRKLDSCSNINTGDFSHALRRVRDAKIATDAAYKEAALLTDIVRHGERKDTFPIVGEADVPADTN